MVYFLAAKIAAHLGFFWLVLLHSYLLVYIIYTTVCMIYWWKLVLFENIGKLCLCFCWIKCVCCCQKSIQSSGSATLNVLSITVLLTSNGDSIKHLFGKYISFIAQYGTTTTLQQYVIVYINQDSINDINFKIYKLYHIFSIIDAIYNGIAIISPLIYIANVCHLVLCT